MARNTCFKCGSTRFVIKHHTSYNPEVIVDCCRSCHKKIHDRVRKEGACKYTVEEVKKLSDKSSHKRQEQIRIHFYENMLQNVRLSEVICLNPKTGTLTISSDFISTSGKHVYTEEI